MSVIANASIRSRRFRVGQIVVRVALGVLFLWAAGAKIADPAGFFSMLLGYEVPFPETFLRLVTVALPWLECLCGLALLLNCWPETVRPLVSALCLIFVAMLAQAVFRGLDVNCGCFGHAAAGWMTRPGVALARAFVLFTGSLFLLLPAPART